MDTLVKQPYPDSAARNYPYGKEKRKMRILRSSREDSWYINMIGEIVEIHYFATFGAWDTKGRWLDYYDLSFDLEERPKLNGTEWWQILGVTLSADERDIKRNFRIKSHIFHPDKKPYGNAADFLKLKTAYEQALKSIA